MNNIKSTVIFLLIMCSCIAAQSDSLPKFTLDNIIVTADKVSSNLLLSTGAVSTISGEEIKAFTLYELSKSLALVPGINSYSVNGMGGGTTTTLRGFYGGGEADYILLMLDGRTLNRFESGIVDWNIMPLSALESVEFVKGGISSLYGDAAIGGVVNLRTKNSNINSTTVRTVFGSYKYFNGQISSNGKLNSGNYNIYFYRNQYEGFRGHSKQVAHSLGGIIPLFKNHEFNLSASLLNNWKNEDKPGVLTGEQTEADRNISSPFFGSDNRTSRINSGDIKIEYTPNSFLELNAAIGGEYNRVNDITTFLLSPFFADTKNREYQYTRYFGSMLSNYKLNSFLGSELLLGAEISTGKITNTYYNFLSGDINAYEIARPQRGTLDENGEGRRTSAAAFIQFNMSPINNLKISLGGRYDQINDSYSSLTTGAEKSFSSKKNAMSPKAGFNYRFANNVNYIASIYASLSGSFKAPTMDQLFDQRSYPAPFEPYKILLSNNLLQPQKSLNIEAGMYQGFVVGKHLRFEVSTSAYQIKMKDEIDFDIMQFKYVNIGKSTHIGLEAGVKIFYSDFISSFFNYSYQEAKAANGSYEGKKLKGIPANTINGGVAYNVVKNFTASMMMKHTAGIFIDDENLIQLPSFTTFDASLRYSFYQFNFSLSSENIFDKKFNANGYIDPSGTPGFIYYYPAAGRRINFSVEVNI